MYQGGTMQSVVSAFASQLKMCQAAQLFVDQRQQGVQSLAVALPPLMQQLRYLVCGLVLHGDSSAGGGACAPSVVTSAVAVKPGAPGKVGMLRIFTSSRLFVLATIKSAEALRC